MQNINQDDFEKKVQQVLERKKEELYREFYIRMGIEERRR